MPADPRFGGRQVPPDLLRQHEAGLISSAELEQKVMEHYDYWDAHGGDMNGRLRAGFAGISPGHRTERMGRARDALGRFSSAGDVPAPETGEKRFTERDGRPMLTMNERIRAAVSDPSASPSHSVQISEPSLRQEVTRALGGDD